MSEGSQFRDGHGRLVGLGHLLGFVLAGFVVGLAALLVLDAVLALTGVSRFGRANGWLAVILPVWLFVEEFRAWRGQPGRVPAAFVSAALGLALGTLATGLASDLPPLASGAIGAGVAVAAYGLVWFYGIRWMGGRTGGPAVRGKR
jgi:hypothetical protein